MPPTFWEQHGLLGDRWRRSCCSRWLALAVWFLLRPKPPVVVPPEVQARQALEPLRQQPEDGALLSRVSQVLRHYVAAAFDLPPGRTDHRPSSAAPLPATARSARSSRRPLSEFLRRCDERKFAPATPAAAAAARSTQALKLD